MNTHTAIENKINGSSFKGESSAEQKITSQNIDYILVEKTDKFVSKRKEKFSYEIIPNFLNRQEAYVFACIIISTRQLHLYKIEDFLILMNYIYHSQSISSFNEVKLELSSKVYRKSLDTLSTLILTQTGATSINSPSKLKLMKEVNIVLNNNESSLKLEKEKNVKFAERFIEFSDELISDLNKNLENLEVRPEMFGFDKVSELNSILEDIGSKIPEQEVLTKFMEKLGNSSQTVSDFMNNFSSSSFKDFVPESLLSGNSIAKISLIDVSLEPILFLASLGWHLRERSWESFGVLVCCTVYGAFAGSFKNFLGRLFEMVFVKLLPDSEVTSEFGESDFAMCCDMFSTATMMFFSFKDPKPMSRLIYEFFGNFRRTKEGFLSFSKMIMELVGKLVNLVRNQYFDSPSIRLLESENSEYNKYCNDVRRHVHSFNSYKISSTWETYSTTLSLIEVGKDICCRIGSDPVGKELLYHLHEDLRELRNVRSKMEAANKSFNGMRPEAVGIFITGGAGSGKSNAMWHLSTAVCSAILQGEEREVFNANPSTQIYNRQAENVYWEGYRHCLVTTFDDFGQSKDVAGSPDNEFMNWIRACNSFEYNLHMAGMESKGNVTFQSKFVIASSNLTRLSPESIVSSEALFRRMNIPVVCAFKREYCTEDSMNKDIWNRKVDINKLPKVDVFVPEYLSSYVVTDFNPDLQEFYVIDKDFLPTGVVLSFDQLVRLSLEKYHSNMKIFNQNFKMFQKTSSKYASMFQEILDENVPQFGEEHFDKSIEMDDMYLEGDFDEDADFRINYELCIVNMLRRLTNDQYMHIIQYLKDQYWKNYSSIHRDKYECTHLDEPIFSTTFYSMLSDVYGEKEIYNFVKHYLDNGMDVSVEGNKLYTLIPLHEQECINPGFVKSRIRLAYSELKKRVYVAYFAFYPTVKDFFLMEGEYESKTKWGLTVLGLFITSGLVGSLANFVYKFFNSKVAEGEPESINHGDKLKSAKTVTKITSLKDVSARLSGFSKPELGTDCNGVDLVKSRLKTNMFEFWLKAPNGKDKVAQGFIMLVCNDVALMPLHFLLALTRRIEEESGFLERAIHFKRMSRDKTKEIVIECTVEELLSNFVSGQVINMDDLILIKIPNCRVRAPSIIGNFPSKKDYDGLSGTFDGCLINSSDTSYCKTRFVKDSLNVNGSDQVGVIWELPKYFCYEASTSRGDCGSLMLRLNAKENKVKIFGMHTAGNNSVGIGYSSCIIREDIEACLLMLEVDHTQFLGRVNGMAEAEVGDFGMSYIGRVDKYPSNCLISEIIPSKVHGCCGKVTTAPARLKPFKTREGFVINPMVEALLKYDIQRLELDDVVKNNLVLATENVKNLLFEKMGNFGHGRVYSLKEALDGILDDPFFDKISSKTSPGFPMNLPNEENLKRLYFDQYNSEEDRAEAYLKTEIEIEGLIETLKSGERPFFVCFDCPKDERRSLEKVAAGKTRLFSASPYLLLILNRMYFGDFSTNYAKAKINNGCAIGVNPYSSEWEDIVKKLSQFDDRFEKPKVGAGDFSGFDCSEIQFVHKLIFRNVIEQFYGDTPDNDIRRILELELYNSRHVFLGDLYIWDGSLPSGHYLTAIMNSLYNHVAFNYCFIRTLEESTMEEKLLWKLNYFDFYKVVYLIVLGDDNVYVTDKRIRNVFKEASLTRFMAEIGLKYTNEEKSSYVLGLRNLDEVSFLKRKFIFDKTLGRSLAPLELSVILDIPYWTKSKPDRDEIAASNIECALNELSLHDVSIWNDYSKRIIYAAKTAYPDAVWVLPLNSTQSVRKSRVVDEVSWY